MKLARQTSVTTLAACLFVLLSKVAPAEAYIFSPPLSLCGLVEEFSWVDLPESIFQRHDLEVCRRDDPTECQDAVEYWRDFFIADSTRQDPFVLVGGSACLEVGPRHGMYPLGAEFFAPERMVVVIWRQEDRPWEFETVAYHIDTGAELLRLEGEYSRSALGTYYTNYSCGSPCAGIHVLDAAGSIIVSRSGEFFVEDETQSRVVVASVGGWVTLVEISTGHADEVGPTDLTPRVCGGPSPSWFWPRSVQWFSDAVSVEFECHCGLEHTIEVRVESTAVAPNSPH